MSLLLSLASRAAPVVDLEAEMDHRLQDMASRYMFATNAEMNTGLDREMADLGVGIRKTAARRQERKDVAGGRRQRSLSALDLSALDPADPADPADRWRVHLPMDERTDLRAASPLEDDDEGEEDEGDEGDGDDEVGALASLAAPANGSAAVGGAARPVAPGAAPARRRGRRQYAASDSVEAVQRPLASAPVDIWGELTARNCNAVRFDYTEGVDACAMCQTVAESLHRSEAVCHCYKSRRGSEYYEKCGEMLGRLRAQADDVKAEADDNNWSDLYRSFGACEYVKFCPG